MANVKISNLPLQTGTTTLDLLAIVDSGLTQTAKVDIQTLFRASGSTITQSNGGHNNIILGASSSSITDTSSEAGDNAILASTNSTINKNQGARAAIIASNQGIINNNAGEGAMNMIGASYNNSTIEGGFANAMLASTGGYIVRGERNIYLGSSGGGIDYAGNTALIASNSFSMNNTFNSTALSAEIGTISNHRYTMVGAHYIYNESDGGNQCVMLGGENNTFSSRGGFASFKSGISVKGSTIQDEGASLISASGRSSNYAWTLHTDNIHTYKTETFDVINAGNVSGSIDVDCSLGTIFKFTLIGNTTPNFINVRTGQRFIFIVYNNGSFTVPTATVGGVSGTVYAKNGSINPTNNGYTKYTATYDGTYMYLDEELAFSAV